LHSFLCRRTGWNLELFHPICSGLYWSTGKNGRLFSDRNPGGISGWKVFCNCVYAVYKSKQINGIYSLINIILVLVAIIHPGWIGVWSIFLTSFFMSLMYPTIFAMSIKGLGQNTKIGGSLLVMAIIGGAFWTPIMGLIFMHTHSMALAMAVPLLAYIFISYYAYFGSKAKINVQI